MSRNVRIYLASTLLNNLTAAFGDAAVLLPALALRLAAALAITTAVLFLGAGRFAAGPPAARPSARSR
jgi:hypothetical protein